MSTHECLPSPKSVFNIIFCDIKNIISKYDFTIAIIILFLVYCKIILWICIMYWHCYFKHFFVGRAHTAFYVGNCVAGTREVPQKWRYTDELAFWSPSYQITTDVLSEKYHIFG